MPLVVGPFHLGLPSSQDRVAIEQSALRQASKHSDGADNDLPFSFPHVGVTRTAPPLPDGVAAEGWTLDHNRVQVGRGRGAYRKAQRLLQQWRHFDLGWASTNAPPVKAGAPVVVTAKTLFVWSCNPLRVSFVEECSLRPAQLPPWAGAGRGPAAQAPPRGVAQLSSSGGGAGLPRLRGAGSRPQQQQQQQARPPRGRRYAFAHTTLAGHQIRGEERFAVCWNQEDDTVWYEIYTLSRPGSWISAATQPLLRAFQRKFARDSMAAMQREMLKP